MDCDDRLVDFQPVPTDEADEAGLRNLLKRGIALSRDTM